MFKCLTCQHLSDQGTFTPVGAQGGGISSNPPPRENNFPTVILQWNLHHLCTGNKNNTILRKNKQTNKQTNVVPFQNGGQITDFCFASFRFWPNFEKTLSQRNFSMKFGSQKRIWIDFHCWNNIVLKLFCFKMVVKTIFWYWAIMLIYAN